MPKRLLSNFDRKVKRQKTQDNATFEAHRKAVEESLSSAFAKGSSTAVQGLIRAAPSDHLPISVNFLDIKAVSWNLLADCHLYNNLRNVSGSQIIIDNLSDKNGFKDKLHYFFSSLSGYILDRANQTPDIAVDKQMLLDFLSTQEKYQKDSAEIVNLLLNSNHPNHADFQQSIVHSIEIMQGIREGYLSWKERIKLIEANTAVVSQLAKKDFICLQECSDPESMLALIKKHSSANQNFVLLQHAVRQPTTDNCVIIYDANQYSCQKQVGFGLARNTKPCLMGNFQSKKDSTHSVIVGSIHHPGGSHQEMNVVLEKAASLRSHNEPVCIMGDLNHQGSFFKENIDPNKFSVITPKAGTMAGPDFGNTNLPIDGVLSSDPKNTQVAAIKDFKRAPPVELPIKIKIDFEEPKARIKPKMGG